MRDGLRIASPEQLVICYSSKTRIEKTNRRTGTHAVKY